MQWMISHQQARRNLTPGELIFANSMVAEEIAAENKKKMLEGYSKEKREENSSCVHMDTASITRDRSTNTREQVAKLSGVGTGTVARYDAVMKSDDEELADVTSLPFNVLLWLRSIDLFMRNKQGRIS